MDRDAKARERATRADPEDKKALTNLGRDALRRGDKPNMRCLLCASRMVPCAEAHRIHSDRANADTRLADLVVVNGDQEYSIVWYLCTGCPWATQGTLPVEKPIKEPEPEPKPQCLHEHWFPTGVKARCLLDHGHREEDSPWCICASARAATSGKTLWSVVAIQARPFGPEEVRGIVNDLDLGDVRDTPDHVHCAGLITRALRAGRVINP